jgi:hypothetical protein
MTDQTPIVPAIRRDGWTPERITQFLDHLANDGSVRAACGRVGMSREAAYRKRRRDAVFARTWDAALVLARAASAEVLANRAIDGVEEEIWYRGELVGTRRKYDSRLLLAHLARLDKISNDERAGEDAGRFDELLALAAGETVPDELRVDPDGLPLERIENAVIAATEARRDLHYAWVEAENARAERLDRLELTPEQRTDAEIAEEMEHDTDCEAEAIRQGRAMGMIWGQWRARAHARVDRLLAVPREEHGETPSTLSELSTSAVEPPAEAAGTEEPDTVADVADPSTSPADVPAVAPATPEEGTPEREPRYEAFRGPTSWLDYCEARKAFHQRQLQGRARD